MRYAVISDIHGNYPALKAVLADAGTQGTDTYLLLGDYTVVFPWVNEVTETIRGLKPSFVIRGNGEDYLIDLQKKVRRIELFHSSPFMDMMKKSPIDNTIAV